MIISLHEEYYELFVCGPTNELHKLSDARIGCMPNNFGEGGLSGEEMFHSYYSDEDDDDNYLTDKRAAVIGEIAKTNATGITVTLIKWTKTGIIPGIGVIK